MAKAPHTPKAYISVTVITVVVVFATCWLADLIGNLPLSFGLLWLPLLYKFVWAAPAQRGAHILFILGMLLEPPDERAGAGLWETPLRSGSVAFFGSLKAWLGIPGLSLNIFTVLSLLMLWKAYGEAKKQRTLPDAQPVRAMQIYLLALVVVFVWGWARGGAVQPAFWQIIQAFYVGIAGFLYLYSIRKADDVRPLGAALLIVAIAKGLMVIWVYEVVCRPLNIVPTYATTHSDSVTFAAAFVAVCTRWLCEGNKPAVRQALLFIPFIVVVVIMNNRRLAFVGMGVSLLTSYLMLEKGRVKRKVSRWALVLLPVFAVYVVVGGNSSSPVFAPAKAFNSITKSSDSSSITREIENYNLIQTAKRVLVFGAGLGHEYLELIRADDISSGHELYLYIPHNSVLWLLGVGGAVGFGLLWLPYPALSFFASRAYRISGEATSKTAALTCLSTSFILMSQAWGDMGTNSFTCALLHGACFGAAGRLAQTKASTQRQRPPPSTLPVNAYADVEGSVT